MTVPIWPSELEQRVMAQGFSLRPAEVRSSSRVDTGIAKLRGRGSAASRPFLCQTIVTFDGAARFERFWADDAGRGVLPFWLPGQTLDGVQIATEAGEIITTEADDPIVIADWWLVRFAPSEPVEQISIRGALFQLSFKLEILP